MAGLGRKTWAADEILAADDLQGYIQDQVVFVFDSAGARTSGILSPSEGMVSYLKDTNLLYVFDGSSWVEVAPDVGTPGTYTKVTTDFKGRVTSGTTLSATDIPSLDASKTTTGSFSADRIPSLDASKITTGTFSADRIGNGTISDAKLVSVQASRLTGNISLPFNGITMYEGIFNNNLQSVGAYSQNNTGRAVFISSSGLFGIGSSSARYKDNIVDAEIDTDAVLKMKVRNFTYKPDRIESDGSVQVGVIAEELVALGLEDFVFFNEDGEPDGVAYEKLALALIPVVQSQASKMDLFEARLKKLESK
jgi:hypothetical protein